MRNDPSEQTNAYGHTPDDADQSPDHPANQQADQQADSHADPHDQQPVGAPEMGRPAQSSFTTYEPEAPKGPDQRVIFGILAACALLMVVGLGKVFLFPSKAPARPSYSAPSDSPAGMMREALNMAREAQQQQREHMRLMREQMDAAEYGYDSMYSEDVGYGAYGSGAEQDRWYSDD